MLVSLSATPESPINTNKAGVLAGTLVGSVGLVALIVGVFWFSRRGRRRHELDLVIPRPWSPPNEEKLHVDDDSQQPQPRPQPDLAPSPQISEEDTPAISAIRAELLAVRQRVAILEAGEVDAPPDYVSSYIRSS
ncbi:hypothetical protein PM082_009459 [Marasmius tenuissimus]|nr:hypothetical protein PM082_009459 [Marasmius tenuissimus]